MDKRTNKNINSFISALDRTNLKVVKAFLFGSYAKGKSVPDSDIDIALIVENLTEAEKFDQLVQLILIGSEIDSRIEPHLISLDDFESGIPFAYEVENTGIEILPDTSFSH